MIRRASADVARASGWGLFTASLVLALSLGIVTRPFHVIVIEMAAAILTLQAIAINRIALDRLSALGAERRRPLT